MPLCNYSKMANKKDDITTMSGRIRYARNAAGKNQDAMAKVLNVSPVAYGHYERGRNEMSLTGLVKFCSVTETRPEWVLCGLEPIFTYDSDKKHPLFKVLREIEDEDLTTIYRLIKPTIEEYTTQRTPNKKDAEDFEHGRPKE